MLDGVAVSMAKRLIAWGMLAGAGLLAYAWMGERPRLRLRIMRVGWPRGAGLKILHLSDQHFGADSWVQRQRIAWLSHHLPHLQPDLILLTGDFLHDAAGLSAVEVLLQRLPAAPLGTYAVLGNHDYALYSYGELFRNMAHSIRAAATPAHKLSALLAEANTLRQLAWNIYRNQRLRFAAVSNPTAALRQLLAAYHVTLLENQAVPLPGRPDIWLAGVDDLVEGQPDLHQALARIPAEAAVILLSHNPDLLYTPAARRVQLAFCGHTHGGQVRLPGVGALHTQSTYITRQRAAGCFEDLPGGGKMIISAGMGESTPFRLGVPPEVLWIEVV